MLMFFFLLFFFFDFNLISKEISGKKKLNLEIQYFLRFMGSPSKARRGEWLSGYQGDMTTGQSVHFRAPVGSRTRSFPDVPVRIVKDYEHFM